MKGSNLVEFLMRNPDVLARRSSVGDLRVPHVELSEDRQRLVVGQQRPSYKKARKGLLEQFISLSDTSDPEAFLKYARHWGVLGLCRHDLPWTHSLGPSRDVSTPSVSGRCLPESSENIRSWSALARLLLSFLNIAAALHSNQPGSAKDWGVLYSGDRNRANNAAAHPLNTQKSYFAVRLSRALSEANIQTSVRWGGVDRNPTLGYNLGTELFGHLILQVAVASCRRTNFFRCSVCGSTYIPRRMPKHGQQNYCPNCRATGVPARLASRMYRKRKANSDQ
jgi:hypothetical protein